MKEGRGKGARGGREGERGGREGERGKGEGERGEREGEGVKRWKMAAGNLKLGCTTKKKGGKFEPSRRMRVLVSPSIGG